MWIRCAELLETPPEECIAIDDHLPGLTGAKKAGTQTIYYHRFDRQDKACSEIAEQSVESFYDILVS